MHRALSLTPFAVPVAEYLFAGTYLARGMGSPPDIVGIPLGVVVQTMLLAWATLGAVLVWRARSMPWATWALLIFAPLAIVGLVFAPAVVMLMANIG